MVGAKVSLPTMSQVVKGAVITIAVFLVYNSINKFVAGGRLPAIEKIGA